MEKSFEFEKEIIFSETAEDGHKVALAELESQLNETVSSLSSRKV